MCRDFQRSRVYAWEFEAIPAGRMIAFEEIQGYVNRVWAAEGLKFPPIVRPMPKQVTRWAGKGNRESVWFPEKGALERTILHELAHSMTCTIDGGAFDLHGPEFVGQYMKLAAAHLSGVSIFALWFTAQRDGVAFAQKL